MRAPFCGEIKMVWIWLANTIACSLTFTIWSKNSLINLGIKFTWLVLGIVNGVMLYRELDKLGVFTAAGG